MARRSICWWVVLAALAWLGVGRQAARADKAVQLDAGQSVDAVGDPLPAQARLRLGSLRFRHPSTVIELGLSPDGKTLVTIGDVLIAWDAETGQERWRSELARQNLRLPAASYGMHAIAFSPEGRGLLTPGPNNEVWAWDMATGKHQSVAFGAGGGRNPNMDMGGGSSRSIDAAPNGQKVAVGSARGLEVCDETGQLLYEIKNKFDQRVPSDRMNKDRLWFGGHYSYGVFSPDGAMLAVVLSGATKEIRLVAAESGEELRRVALEGDFVRLAFSPDSKRLAVTERDNAVRLYTCDDGKRAWSHVVNLTNPHENYTSGVAFAPDGKLVAIGATDKALYLLDAASGDEVGKLVGHNWYPWSLAFAKDGKTLYSAGWDGRVRRWDMATRKQLPLPMGVRATGTVGVSPDGKLLAYEDDDGACHLADGETGQELKTLKLPGVQFSQFAFSPDSKRLAAGGTFNDQVHVSVWDLATNEVVRKWEWPQGKDPHSEVEALAWTPDGKRLAAAVFRQSACYVWDVDGDKQLWTQPHKEIYGLGFSPGGGMLATVGWDSRLRFWRTDTGEKLRAVNLARIARTGADKAIGEDPFGGSDLDVRSYAVCFAPHGGRLATQHMNGQVWLWDAATFRVQAKASPGSPGYGVMAFSPDGTWLAAGSSSGSVHVYDADSGETAWTLERAHQDNVYNVAFGRDLHELVTGGDDGACYVWDARLGRTPSTDAPKVWDELAGRDAKAAFLAMVDLAAMPDKATPVLLEKLKAVTLLVDPVGRVDELAKHMQTAIVEKAPGVLRRVTAERAVALLRQFDTAESKAALAELAELDSDVGQLAREAAGDALPAAKSNADSGAKSRE